MDKVDAKKARSLESLSFVSSAYDTDDIIAQMIHGQKVRLQLDTTSDTTFI